MATAPQDAPERRSFRVLGVVQGVGFRPFVHGLARRHDLGGFVVNDGSGVAIEAEGPPGALDAFASALVAEAPALAQVEEVIVTPAVPAGGRDFVIAPSPNGGGTALVPPDAATCEDCLRELFDPGDRRHGYPFINCTQCGPRLTIVERSPYDRSRTTMAGFEMCPDCRREYEDPGDRRFHAEPIACPACGPSLDMPLDEATRLLRDGAVVAVKGLGGWHLACLAADEEAVARLRARKRREDKPFAVMTADPWSAGPKRCAWAANPVPRGADPRTLVDLSEEEVALLRSPARPIVLARRRPGAPVAEAVAPGSPWLGVLLPYTPLHWLLLEDLGAALVMTSGNRSDEPIATGDEEARSRLTGIADAFLGHDRPIRRRCEDSVVRAEFAVRRSRGHSPAALPLPVPAPVPLVATGAELKSTFCVAVGGAAHPSPHLGDLDGELAYRAFTGDLDLYLEMLGVTPGAVACDMHPDYVSTGWAQRQGLDVIAVQHHHAHAASCLAEHGRAGPALALVFDGTGYGTDGTLWGGELLRCDLDGFERVAHLAPVPLPGGEAAIRQPWRSAAAHLEAAGRAGPWPAWEAVRESLKVNAPLSSGAGRLFDAVAALLGVREEVTYEGQAAIELENLAADAAAPPYPCDVQPGVIPGSQLVAAAHDDLLAGRDRSEIAAAFHEGLAVAAVRACALAAEPRTVVLSGGTFQNLRLLDAVRRGLRDEGFEVLSHRRVPPNDGGISYGQAAVAARRMARCA